MSSAVARIGVVLLALAQLGVSGFYAPVHRMLHHSLRHVDANQSSATATGCHSACCHHHATQAATVSNGSSDEPTPTAPCPDDENSCVWCAIALHQADATKPAAEVAVVELIEFVSTPHHPPVAARPAMAFDVRGPPAI